MCQSKLCVTRRMLRMSSGQLVITCIRVKKIYINTVQFLIRGAGKSHMFKSQVTVQTNQASQFKSVAHLKQVKSSPDKGQVELQYQTETNISLPNNQQRKYR